MNGPLRCGWGCGSHFYNADEQQAHEQACARRPQGRRGDGLARNEGDLDVAGALAAVASRSRAA